MLINVVHSFRNNTYFYNFFYFYKIFNNVYFIYFFIYKINFYKFNKFNKFFFLKKIWTFYDINLMKLESKQKKNYKTKYIFRKFIFKFCYNECFYFLKFNYILLNKNVLLEKNNYNFISKYTKYFFFIKNKKIFFLFNVFYVCFFLNLYIYINFFMFISKIKLFILFNKKYFLNSFDLCIRRDSNLRYNIKGFNIFFFNWKNL